MACEEGNQRQMWRRGAYIVTYLEQLGCECFLVKVRLRQYFDSIFTTVFR